jgi:arsenite/tail-anchored protein-transporting ATPase
VELSDRASLRSLLRVPEIADVPRSIGSGLSAVAVRPEAALVDLLGAFVPSRRLVRAVLDNRVLDRLLRALPAVGEVVSMHALRRLLDAREGEAPRWDPIVVDLEASGHAVMTLEVRDAVGPLVGRVGPLRDLLDDMAARLADPQCTRLHVVTLPEPLPVTETCELWQGLRARGRVALGGIVINRVPGPRVSAPALAAAQAWRPMLDDPARAALAGALALAQAQEQERLRREHDARGLADLAPTCALPDLGPRRAAWSDLAQLGARVWQELP